MESLPKSQDLISPMLVILARQNGPMSIDEIEAAVGKELAIPEALQVAIHSGKRTEFQYRLAWARTKAKLTGWIESPKREYWEITKLGKSQFPS